MVLPRVVVGLALGGLIAGAAVSAQQPKSAPAKPAPAKTAPAKDAAGPAGPVLVLEFAKGPVEIETYPSDAPKSVEHIVGLFRTGFYRGLRIQWSTPSLVQFGDPLTKDMTKKQMWGSGGGAHPVGVEEAAMAKHKFVRGTVGLAYRQDFSPKTADSYVFIIKGENTAANGKYAVLGHVTEGMAIVDKLEVEDIIKNAYVKGEKK